MSFMTAQYPPEVHALYRSAVSELWDRLCRGEISMAGVGPLLPVACRAGCADHEFEVNERTLRRLVMDINSAAHALIEADFTHLPEVQLRELHAGLLDVSREHCDFFDDIQAAKRQARKRSHHAHLSEKRRAKNRAIELDVAAGQVAVEHLLEFAACYRKRRYGSRENAEVGLEVGGHGADASYQVYACDYCGGWHVGHRVGRTAPDFYRVTRAQMLWSTHRALANRFAAERQLTAEAG